MCLILDNKTKKPPTKPVRVYKVYTRQVGGKLRSVSMSNTVAYKRGQQIVSNRPFSNKVTFGESQERRVNYGFHTFTVKRQAEMSLRRSKNRVLVEMEGKPEHFVAFGTNNGDSKGAVFSTLTFKKMHKRQARK